MRTVDNDAARHDLLEVLALVQEQMTELADFEEKRAALSATATSADGTVVVTVNVDGLLTETAVSESYLDEYDLADLGGHLTAAAQAAVCDVERQAAELLAPLAERRAQVPALSEIVQGAPDIRDLVSPAGESAHGGAYSDAQAASDSDYPTVRSWR
ncbi:YbaB/EbfC family nucleoid-associated protein [Mycobacterium sp. 21AC1]|uniref:YbaB/EbfC family nucleoid-associated protein n=1 Tax=[Mycobacterium] appelbergii TaxID=2939269 RepID=UPI0029393C5B|nr:YbaB/EbfC family nucleoid-associated protein [Mycobacterium sp. 21AC1]MDV3124017.1 YbaB/EbfC family nucleoid-associated protein [Mycobacterium sp. 21AC1]